LENLQNLPPVLFYRRNENGRFVVQNLREDVDEHMRGVTREYLNLTQEEKALVG